MKIPLAFRFGQTWLWHKIADLGLFFLCPTLVGISIIRFPGQDKADKFNLVKYKLSRDCSAQGRSIRHAINHSLYIWIRESLQDSVKIDWTSVNIAPLKKIISAILTEIQWIFT